MPTFYNYRESGIDYSLDDVFVPANAFRQGNLWVWGENQWSALGEGITQEFVRSTPITTFAGGGNWKQISGGRYMTGGIKTDGTLWMWGIGDRGYLGNNTQNFSRSPITTFAGGNNWKSISCGLYHVAAIKTDGTLWVWGQNYGTLGDNTQLSKSTPITTFAGGTNWKMVDVADYAFAAIKTDGTLWTWGGNYGGEAGINSKIFQSTPVTTFAGGKDWKSLSLRAGTVAAIKNDGTLWCWGDNNLGQIGDNTVISKSTPVTTFAGGANWKQVSAGSTNSCAVKNDGTLWIWGGNDYGSLGNNTIVQSLTPVTTFAGGTNWKMVSSACSAFSIFDGTLRFAQFNTAIKTNGTLWLWGYNGVSTSAKGTLGHNINQNSYTPITTFRGGSNWNTVTATYTMVGAIEYIDSTI